MSRTIGFLNWIQEKFGIMAEFQQITTDEFPIVEKFNLGFRRSRSLRDGNQWYFFKIMPPDITLDDTRRITAERKFTLKKKAAYFKLYYDFLVFFYITEQKIPPFIFESLGNFNSVKKKLLGNVIEVNFLFDLSSGYFTYPRRIGWSGRMIIHNLIREAKINIFEPYQQWLKTATSE